MNWGKRYWVKRFGWNVIGWNVIGRTVTTPLFRFVWTILNNSFLLFFIHFLKTIIFSLLWMIHFVRPSFVFFWTISFFKNCVCSRKQCSSLGLLQIAGCFHPHPLLCNGTLLDQEQTERNGTWMEQLKKRNTPSSRYVALNFKFIIV